MQTAKRVKARGKKPPESGFTLVEMLIGSTILLVVIVITMSLYNRSNKIVVDQQQYSDIQHDVRSAMYFISRDVQNAGVGFNAQLTGFFIEGTDAFGPGPESSDALRLMGNYEFPLSLRIERIVGVNARLYDGELLNMPYTCPDDLVNRTVMLVSTSCPGCFAYRYIGPNSVKGCDGTNSFISFQSSSSELNPPGGKFDESCGDECWENGIITFGEIKYYWLDTTGYPADYSGLNLTVGGDGYLGIANTLYMTSNLADGSTSHTPVSMDIESIQFQYNGDLDEDGVLDGFTDWDNANWTILAGDDSATRTAKGIVISRIRQVRMWVLGRTPKAFVSIRGTQPTSLHIFRRPAVANVAAASVDDNHRRFLLESAATIRNMSLGLYNEGIR
ncbi:MAG: prepilin-type N-terminal cleavage/methylation domain-containing protein [Acidobacteria bacterium]|nr:prepilin-type N-terminal cleavage/methylation domain-containing protein [Acidobacteriota bacterium]